MNACYLRVLIYLILHASTYKALTNAHVTRDFFGKKRPRHVLVCKKKKLNNYKVQKGNKGHCVATTLLYIAPMKSSLDLFSCTCSLCLKVPGLCLCLCPV